MSPSQAILERMAESGTLNTDAVINVLVEYLGTNDARIQRIRKLA